MVRLYLAQFHCDAWRIGVVSFAWTGLPYGLIEQVPEKGVP